MLFRSELCYNVKEHYYDNNMQLEFSDEVKRETSLFKANNDTIMQFFNETNNYEVTGNENDYEDKIKN